MAELQSSSVVVQVSDDSPTGCTELIRMLEVNRNVFNAMRQAKDRIRSQPVAFPTPETSPDRSAMTFEWRVIIDVGGDLIKSGFARDVSD